MRYILRCMCHKIGWDRPVHRLFEVHVLCTKKKLQHTTVSSGLQPCMAKIIFCMEYTVKDQGEYIEVQKLSYCKKIAWYADQCSVTYMCLLDKDKIVNILKGKCKIRNNKRLHIWPITGNKVQFCFSGVQWSEMQRTPINCGHALRQLF